MLIKYEYKKKIFILYLFKTTIIIIFFIYNRNIHKQKIGVIGLNHSQNIGNILLKFAMFIKLSELGYDPYIIGLREENHNISFLQRIVNLRIINNNFNEIQKNEYNVLMVNSDQTWRKWDTYFYDIAFLQFAKDWKKKKFIYGASLGLSNWSFNEEDEIKAKYLLKNFSGISLREKGSINLVYQKLGINPVLVLDPTLLIDKKRYLELIDNFVDENIIDKNTIFVYTVTNSILLKNYLNKIVGKYNLKLYYIDIWTNDNVQKFIYGIKNCKAIITDSYHCTIFSLIFEKPFLSFIYEDNGKERFYSLNEIFNISNRIYNLNDTPDINILETPLFLNKTLFNSLKKKSINFLKKNLINLNKII
jgi:hypothetical protein